jgi:hypothetical protein
MSIEKGSEMKVDVYLVESGGFERVCHWRDPGFLKHVTDCTDIDDIFDVVITVENHEFSGFSRSLKNVVLDMLINHRILLKGSDFGYFVSDEPLFTISQERGDVFVWYYDELNRKIVLNDTVSNVDREMTRQCCFGLDLLSRLSPSNSDQIFDQLHEDLNSRNRAAFIKKK